MSARVFTRPTASGSANPTSEVKADPLACDHASPLLAWLDTDVGHGKPVYDSMAVLPAALWLPVAVAVVAADVAVTTVLPPMVVVPAVEGALPPFDSL